MSRETERLILKAMAAMIIAVSGAWIAGRFTMEPRAFVITLCVTGFLAGIVSGERLCILISPISAWGLFIIEAWLFPTTYTFPVQDLLPWNILFTDYGVWDLIIIVIPTGTFAFVGWLCRVTVAWVLDDNRMSLGEAYRDVSRGYRRPIVWLLTLFGILTVPIMPFIAIPICAMFLIAGSILLIRSTERGGRLSGAILSAGGVVMIPAIVIALHSFYNL